MILLMTLGPDYDCEQTGWLVTPRTRDSIEKVVQSGLPWACDNGCYSDWQPDRFVKLLERVKGQPRLLWVAVPDVVADHTATVRRFRQWRDLFIHLGVPMAFVLQDGATAEEVPWELLKAVFVGGSTAWKMGPDAAALVAEAKGRGLWVHMGRVNSIRRMHYARSIGCDSVDGTQWSRFKDTYVERARKGLTGPFTPHIRDLL